MGRRMVGILGLAAVCLAAASSLYSQAKKDASGLYRIEGSVVAIDKENAVIKVKEASSNNVTWAVAYTPETTFTTRNESAKADAVQVGSQVICLGKYQDPQKDKTRMTAVRIDVRKKYSK